MTATKGQLNIYHLARPPYYAVEREGGHKHLFDSDSFIEAVTFAFRLTKKEKGYVSAIKIMGSSTWTDHEVQTIIQFLGKQERSQENNEQAQ